MNLRVNTFSINTLDFFMTKNFLFVDEIDVTEKRVLLRLDVNVPLKEGRVSDDTRIRRVLPGIKELTLGGAKVVILTHFGRPEGKVVNELSVWPVAECIGKLLGQRIKFETDVVGAGGITAAQTLQSGQILMMENLRFYPEEEANDYIFAKKLASLGDLYVGDAFSCAHRAHASIDLLPRLLPAAVGKSFASELRALGSVLTNPQRPLIAVVGGSKISSKLMLLENLVKNVDGLVLGGGMANTFLFAKGLPIGKSLCELDMVEVAKKIMKAAEFKGCNLLLPNDVVVAKIFKANALHRVSSIRGVNKDEMILDAGPKTIDAIKVFLRGCKTIVWNGPLGAFELEPFDAATNELAREVASLTQDSGLKSVAGGGETMAALANAGVNEHFSYVSTAGGAFLEWLEGKSLPGVDALQKY